MSTTIYGTETQKFVYYEIRILFHGIIVDDSSEQARYGSRCPLYKGFKAFWKAPFPSRLIERINMYNYSYHDI